MLTGLKNGLFNHNWIMVKLLILSFYMTVMFGALWTQANVWQPAPQHTQVPLWPGRVPDAEVVKGSAVDATKTRENLIAGKPWLEVGNVVRPTMTVYAPQGKNTGAAVVVFPGGGYQILAIDLEGTEVCDWLTSKGITCVLLKYRVPGTTLYTHAAYPKSGPYPESPLALEDAQRAVGLVRFHAAALHIDPHKIGVLGFSSGGHLVAALSTQFKQRLYAFVDAADKASCRPDFAVAIYPGHLSLSAAKWDAVQGAKKFALAHANQFFTHDERLALNPDLHVIPQTPPTFLLQAEDDHMDNVDDSLAYYMALKKAGVAVEMHLYAQGGHAFGLRRTKFPITRWPQLVETWLKTLGMIAT